MSDIEGELASQGELPAETPVAPPTPPSPVNVLVLDADTVVGREIVRLFASTSAPAPWDVLPELSENEDDDENQEERVLPARSWSVSGTFSRPQNEDDKPVEGANMICQVCQARLWPSPLHSQTSEVRATMDLIRNTEVLIVNAVENTEFAQAIFEGL